MWTFPPASANSAPMRILYVEDSRHLQKSVATALKRAGYSVDVCGDGAEGLHRAAGRDLQVLLLTARDAVPERVRGLQAGADDYLVKPFALDELLARVGVLCRRAYAKKNPLITIGDLVVDTARRSAARAGTSVDLLPREFRILEYLAMRAGEVVSRTDIWNHVYDELTEPMSNAVDSAICTIRKKIEPPGSARLLHTRRGMGYILSA